MSLSVTHSPRCEAPREGAWLEQATGAALGAEMAGARKVIKEVGACVWRRLSESPNRIGGEFWRMAFFSYFIDSSQFPAEASDVTRRPRRAERRTTTAS